MEVSNMLNTGSRPSVMVESTDSGLELADYSANSKADPAKVVVWVCALT